jgi:protein-L-isoaspartate(D-aspartate) O-methyltransferase
MEAFFASLVAAQTRDRNPGIEQAFPLQPERGLGGMLLLKRPDHGPIWPAKFVSRARFVCCEGQQDAEAGRRLTEAFSGYWDRVRSFRIDNSRDGTCWFAGDGWWLSTADSEPPSWNLHGSSRMRR